MTSVMSLHASAAIAGGAPARATFLPHAAPRISDAAIEEVAETLRSGWLATGPKTRVFEERFAAYVGSGFAVGVTSGTAALILALDVAGVRPGDEVITTPLTFVATAHSVLHLGARPVFADVDSCTGNLDPAEVERRLTPRTRAILAVHYAGRPCGMRELVTIAERHGLILVSDAAHAIEATSDARPLATAFAVSAYSFHPTKNLTTGEGGMVVTDRPDWAERLRRLRLHGITSDAWSRRSGRSGEPYDVQYLGYKCNMNEVQASLGLHQLAALEDNLELRRRIWARYDAAFADVPELTPPPPGPTGDRHARHIYTVLVDLTRLGIERAQFCAALRAENIGTAHHYPALHRTAYYRRRFGFEDGAFPAAESIAARSVTLPLWPGMTDHDADTVIEAVHRVVEHYR